MANQNVDRRVLEDAGRDGFATIEQRRAKKADGRANHQKNEGGAIVINSIEAAQRYGGLMIEPTISSDKAAQRYGGVVIGPAISSDKAVQRYGGILIQDRHSDRNPRRT